MSEYEGKYEGNIAALFDGQPFDPNAYEPSVDFDVLPPGKYTCLIESAELKTTLKKTGKYIKIALRVVDGQFKNRKLFGNINVQNPSEDCQRRGIAQLSSIGRAAQCYPVRDTTDLVDKVVVAVVKVKKREDTGEDQNDVRMYECPAPQGGLTPQHGTSPYGPPGSATAQEQPPYANPAPAPRPAVTAEPPATAPGSAPWKQ